MKRHKKYKLLPRCVRCKRTCQNFDTFPALNDRTGKRIYCWSGPEATVEAISASELVCKYCRQAEADQYKMETILLLRSAVSRATSNTPDIRYVKEQLEQLGQPVETNIVRKKAKDLGNKRGS